MQIKNFHAQISCSNKSKVNSSDALMYQAFGPQTQAQGFCTSGKSCRVALCNAEIQKVGLSLTLSKMM